MLYAGEGLHYIPLVDYLYWLSPFLVIASAVQNEQDLATRMTMPIQPCTRIKGCYGNREIERTITGTQLTQPNISRVIFRGG